MSLDADDRDLSVDPGTDLYRHANGGWLDRHPIPPGYGAWGAFEEVSVRNEETLHDLLVRAADAPVDALDRLLGDAFAAGMDVDAVEAAGTAPLAPLLDRIDAIASLDDLLAALPELHRDGVMVLWAGAVTVDHDDSSRHLLWLVPVGLGLPDRDAYVDDSEAAVALREAYVVHVGAQLGNLGDEGTAARAAEVLAFEARLAEHHLTAAERRDPRTTLNRHTLDELSSLAPALDLPGYLTALGAGGVESVNVQQPAYLAALHEVLADTPLPTLRAYLRFHVVHTFAESLPSAIDDEDFSFYGRLVRGQKEQKERFKRVIAAITDDMGEALGQRFVTEVFPPEAKAQAQAMVDEIRAEMRRSLETRTWMSEETRARGLAKLDALGVKIGYPDRWRDWTGLVVSRDGYVANRIAAARFDLEWQLGKLDRPVDLTEWEMPPQVVNAYYHPTRNEIVFPAGILRPPMFDPTDDLVANLGGIGSVIAHEITHGFDDQGRRYDADGAFRDWWTEEDEAAFTELTDRLVAQFDAEIAVDEVHVNGHLTLGENIADLGGLALAARAAARVSAGQPEVGGLTPMQRFFLAYATIWRANVSDELARTLAQVDTHSPRALRVRCPVSNLTAFAEAFDLPDDAPALRPPQERIEIW